MRKLVESLLIITMAGLVMIVAPAFAEKERRYRIAVVDSGFNNIGYFSDQVPLCKDGHHNFNTNRDDLGFDQIGHGTVVTKLINDNARRSDICFMVYKIFVGRYTSDTLISKAVRMAVKRGARVINLSLGGPGVSPKVEKAIRYAGKRGVRIFVAAGNESSNLNKKCNVYPACFDKYVKVVGAVDKEGKVAPYSNHGYHVDYWARGDFGMGVGTSFAAPRVAGQYIHEMRF